MARHLQELAQPFQAPHVERIGRQRPPHVRDLVVDRLERAARVADRVVQRDQGARPLAEGIELRRAPERLRGALRVAPEIAQDRTDAQVQRRAVRAFGDARFRRPQRLHGRLPVALAQIEIGEPLQRLRIAQPQPGGAPQRLHRARPILDGLVAGGEIEPRLRCARVVGSGRQELDQPVGRSLGVAIVGGAPGQLKKRLPVFRLDVQDLLEVCGRRLAIGHPLQSVLTALEQERHPRRRREGRGGQPVRQQVVEQGRPPGRVQVGA